MISSLSPLTKPQRKATGSHYTPTELADFVAAQIVAITGDETGIVLDPACGDGELLRAFRELCPRSQLVGFDLNPDALRLAAKNVGSGRFEQRDFLELAIEYRRGGLFAPVEKADVVIANPPYVRTQVMGADKAQEIANRFALNGRVDLYFAFLEGISEILKPGGIAGVIVSNRFMTTRAGITVRERILENFQVIHVWDLGDTKIFEAAVLPAVLLLRKKDGTARSDARMTSIYTTREDSEQEAATPILALGHSGNVRVASQTFNVQHGTLDHSEGTWRVANNASDSWLATVKSRTAMTFGDIGKIRVGIKTTADKIFVRKSWEEPRPELLRPLLTHKCARRYKSFPPTHEILYTHTMLGEKKVAINIDDYPISKAYLEANKAALEKRTYVIEARRNWFEIWVPQTPSLWGAPKLVWPDIAERATFWISLEGELVQGDCYWLAPEQGKQDLLWLALAVSNSAFIEEFYDRTCGNKLYAGRRRYMTQYVETFPIPDPKSEISKKITADVKKLYYMIPSKEADVIAARLDEEVFTAFGLAPKKVSR
jgi:adenine-specific DNA-methyltransferase